MTLNGFQQPMTTRLFLSLDQHNKIHPKLAPLK